MRPEIKRIEWDSAAFGRNCYEIGHLCETVLRDATQQPGHYAIKVDPLQSKALLHQYGFYYCDTLLEPFCPRASFVVHPDARARFTRDTPLEEVLAICHGAFAHGRFHRDFNLPPQQADLRYDNWLRQLHAAGGVYGLLFEDRLAGFIAVNAHQLVLHAVAGPFRGKGIAKYLWSAVCADLYRHYPVLCSSISASNISAANLYRSLGFRLRHPVDVYHRWTP